MTMASAARRIALRAERNVSLSRMFSRIRRWSKPTIEISAIDLIGADSGA